MSHSSTGCAQTGWRAIVYPNGHRCWVCDDCGFVRFSKPRDNKPVEVQNVGLLRAAPGSLA